MSSVERSTPSTLAEGRAMGIAAAEGVGGFKIRLRFSDGFERVVDFEPFLKSSQHPSIRAFLDPQKFAAFTLEGGDLVWGDYELCFPIAHLYEGQL